MQFIFRRVTFDVALMQMLRRRKMQLMTRIEQKTSRHQRLLLTTAHKSSKLPRSDLRCEAVGKMRRRVVPVTMTTTMMTMTIQKLQQYLKKLLSPLLRQRVQEVSEREKILLQL